MSRRRPANERSCPHGAIGVASIIALVFLQLLIVGGIVAGTRDQELSIVRMDSTRAFYATEAGSNMSMSELKNNVDYDGDGTIGTISDDSNAADDPAIGNARFLVTQTIAGGEITISSVGRCGSASRLVCAVAEQAGGGANTKPHVLYGPTASNIMQEKIWASGSWGSAASAWSITAGNIPRWVTVRVHPEGTEAVAIVGDSASSAQASVYNGSSWSTNFQITTALGTTATRPFDLAYEQASGRAMVAYYAGTGASISYRIWDGSSWSIASAVATSGSGAAVFVRLIPKPGSSEVVCLVLDVNNGLSAMVWNGSSFGNKTLLTASAVRNDSECFDAAYETLSGRCIIGWGNAGGKIWTGSAWAAGVALANTSGKTRTVRICADPVSNKMLSLAVDGQSNIDTSTWNGTSWSAYARWGGDSPNIDRHNFDICFEPAGTRALAVFARSGSSNNILYRTFDGTTWSAEVAGPSMGSTANIIRIVPVGGTSDIRVALERKSDSALYCMRWNGAAMVEGQVVASGMAGGGTYTAFDQFIFGAATSTKLASWTEAEP